MGGVEFIVVIVGLIVALVFFLRSNSINALAF